MSGEKKEKQNSYFGVGEFMRQWTLTCAGLNPAGTNGDELRKLQFGEKNTERQKNNNRHGGSCRGAKWQK